MQWRENKVSVWWSHVSFHSQKEPSWGKSNCQLKTPQRRQGKWSDKDKESENNGESIRLFNNQKQHCWHHAEGTEASIAME